MPSDMSMEDGEIYPDRTEQSPIPLQPGLPERSLSPPERGAKSVPLSRLGNRNIAPSTPAVMPIQHGVQVSSLTIIAKQNPTYPNTRSHQKRDPRPYSKGQTAPRNSMSLLPRADPEIVSNSVPLQKQVQVGVVGPGQDALSCMPKSVSSKKRSLPDDTEEKNTKARLQGKTTLVGPFGSTLHATPAPGERSTAYLGADENFDGSARLSTNGVDPSAGLLSDSDFSEEDGDEIVYNPSSSD